MIDFVNVNTVNGVLSLTDLEKETLFTMVIKLSGIMAIVALSGGFFLYLTRQTIIVMSRYFEYDLKNKVYSKYQELPLQFYRKNNTGDLMNRISDDVSKVRMYVGPAVMYALNLLVIFAIVIPIMIQVSAELTFYCLMPLPFLSVGIYFIANRINVQSEKIQSSLSELSTFVQEAFSGIRILKTFQREEDSVARFNDSSNSYRAKSLELAKINAFFLPAIFGLIGLSTVFTIYFGGLQVLDHQLSYGNIIQFFLYLNMITWPVTSVGWVTSIIQRAAASQKRINEFLDTPVDPVNPNAIKTEIEGNIEFKDVALIYEDSNTRALNNISFTVTAGETLAILGTTGSGKSTIANLMTRMYNPSEGTIYIDNEPIEKYNVSSLREQMGYVPQDAFLFSDTIEKNIGFGASDLPFETIEQAAKDAHVDHNITAFPKGYKTKLGERGVTLSGGQKQRITLARAIIRNPKILILDDSLSAVDTKTENHILDRLKVIMKDRTSLIISHRVSSVKLADKIIVLDQGDIVEQGSHEELINSGGIYKKLYDSQLKDKS